MLKKSSDETAEVIIQKLKEEIHQHQQVEKALTESERKLVTLMNNLPGMAYRCHGDENYTIEFASKGTMALLGCTASELIGSRITNTFRKLVHPEDRDNNQLLIEAAFKERRSFELFYRLRTAKNQIKWVWDRGEGVFSKEGKLLALEGFITDISAHKTVEMELRAENKLLKSSNSDRYKFMDIVGKSTAMQKVYELIIKAATSKASVIVYGESGTGKELVAKAIHNLSNRQTKQFVPVNCGAIPKNLMESEFFGHHKGAFSGAYNNKLGYLDMADGGTLFLDELGEISLDMQVKLLRVLDGEGFMPVGSNTVKKPDVRIIAATNRDMKLLMAEGQIREDFYYRIHILPISLPSLRERKEDIPLLVEHFIKMHNSGKEYSDIPINLLMVLKNQDYPGNIRELRNVVDRYVTLGEIDVNEKKPLRKADVNADFSDDPESTNLKVAINKFEKKFILRLLHHFNWRKGKTAEKMGVTARTLQRKLKQYHIKQ